MVFWIFAALMTAAVTALVMVPLMRLKGGGQAHAADRASYDLEVYRDQLAELDRDLARGIIDRRQADAARAEIGRRMLALADASKAAPAAAGIGRGTRWVALALCALIPLGALAVYLPTGRPTLPAQPFASRDTKPDNPAAPPEVMQAIAKLEQHLKDDPSDLQGWLLLGQTYTRMARFDDALEAYRHAVGVSQGANPTILSSFAEAQVAAAQGMVSEEAQRTFEAVLQADPQDARARYYLALARAQSGDFRGALDRWVELAAQSPADAPWMPTVQQRITDMAGRLGVEVSSVMPQPKQPSQSAAPGPTREQMADAANMTPEQRNQMIRGMVDNLAAKLRDNPADADGWMRLGRAYGVLGERGKAVEAMASAAKAAPERADVLMAYADALIAAGPEEDAPPAAAVPVLRTVLSMQPDNPQALYFLGLDAARTANAAEAAQLWGRLLTRLQPGSPEHTEVQSRIDALKQGG